MARRSLALLGLLSVLTGIVWLPLGAGEKTGTPQVVAQFKGHTDAVYAVAFSPDGKHLATASFDNTLKLWETASGKEIKTYGGTTGHLKQVISVAFNQDGSMLASGSTDNTLKVWDVPVNSPLRSFKADGAVLAVALSPDGTKLALGGKDGALKLVTPAEFKEIVKFEAGHQGAITCLAFNTTGQLLASAGADRTVRYWNVQNGQLIATVGAHAAAVNSIALHANNTAAYSVGDDGLLKFWTLPPAPTRTVPGHAAPIRVLALSADGAQVYTGSDDKTVRHFAVAGAKELRTLSGPAAPITSVAAHPANTFIAAGSQDGHVFLWNGADGKPLANWLAHAGAVHSLQVQGPQLMSTGADGLVKFWSLPAVPPRIMTHPDMVLAAVASPDGKKLFTGSSDKLVRAWDTSKQAIEKQFAGHTGPVTALAISPNLQILASGSADHTIRLWNQTTAKESDVLLAHLAPVSSVSISAAGNQLVSSSEDGTLKLWQLPLAAPKLFIHADQVGCLVLTPDGTKMLTGGNDKIVRLWNLTTGAKERDYAGPALPIVAIALSSNGATLAAASADKTVTLWNLADAKVLQKLPMPALPQALVFSADAQSVFVGLADHGIKLLKVADGKEIKTLARHQGAVVGLALGAKGEVLYSAGADKTIQTWKLPEGAPQAKFDHVAPVTAMALSKDGTRLAASAEKVLKVWTVADGKEVASLKLPADARSLALSPDNTRVLVASADKLARLYELDGKLLEILPHDGPVHAVQFVDARRVVTAGADKLARLWTSALVWHRQHQGPVRQALFTPKGDQVVSAGDDKTIRLWNSADGKEVKTLTAAGAITQVSLSADATRIAAAGADKSVNIWTVADGKASAAIPVAAAVHGLALSPNGLRVAVGLQEGAQQVIRVYDLALGRDVQVLTDHAAPLKSLQFLADNRTLATASMDKTARLLDVGLVAALVAHPPGPLFAQYHGAGAQLLTAGADKTIKLWDLAKAGVLKSFGPLADPIAALAFSKDFTRFGVATGKTVKVWTLADGKEVVTLAHAAEVLSLSFSPDGTRIATGAADKQTRLWDVATGKELQFFPQEDAVAAVHLGINNLVLSAAGKVSRLDTASIQRVLAADAGPVRAMVLTPANTHVVTAGADKTVKLWNLATGAMERAFTGAGALVHAVAVSKSNQLLAAGGADQTVRVYQLADAKELGAVKLAGEVRALGFTPNNLTLVAATAGKTLQALGVPFNPGQPLAPEFLKPVQSFDTPGVQTDFAIAVDNASVYSGSLENALHAWKLASPVPTRNFAHPNHVDAVAFQPQGLLLASGGHDGKIRLFDLIKNAQTKEINAHILPKGAQNLPSAIYSLTFSPDGKQILTSSFDESLKLWDVASGNLVREFKGYKVKEFEKGHQEPVYAAAFSPDGQFIASGSSGLERVIKIWNVGNGTVVRDLANPQFKSAPTRPAVSHPGAVTSLRFTRDGKYLLSVGDAPGNKGFLALWDWHTGTLLRADTLPLGVFYGLDLSPDQKMLAVTAGNRDRKNSSPDFNSTYLMKLPLPDK